MAIKKGVSANLPPNVYRNESKGNVYYRYHHPVTRRFFSLGKNRAKAIEVGNQLNLRLMLKGDKPESLIEHVEAGVVKPRRIQAMTLSKLIDEYIVERVPEKRWGKQTEKNYMALMAKIKREIGTKKLDQIDVLTLSDWLKTMTPAAHTKYRTRLIDIFAYAIACGYVKENPADATLAKTFRPEDKVRKRLTLEQFYAIHDKAPEFLKIAMEIALITLQRRGDIVEMRYDDIRKDQDGVLRWYLVQNKTKKKSDKAFLAIRVTDALQAVISRSRNNIASPFVVHYSPLRKCRDQMAAKEHWTQVTPNLLTNTFAEVRNATGLFKRLQPAERPTFHEIRSLGVHVYEKKLGKSESYTQDLAGHSDRKMTDLYAAGHEVRYNLVDADLDLDLAKRLAGR
ncbi:phage integrase Arm DNA-binding domain-containing protein [Ectothiorhodospira shaposhnikovii]|uniref:phage integrase Arm DNA-binding domain-containing protein n=1 Tax=Ectothiorhodospira shaposhnikovii TaxID=1054 RepID=UPI001EE8C877|nr:phage integrase Arm DNA-binding domain-containing protein [Ectothiorhodospira shaposhnikovii]MCG5512772.1 phage integrase Arm DNA-binding domain-containing protein [Ectothiorhodospira shaposhnikovii]